MTKTITFVCALALVLSTSTLVQAQNVETPQIEVSQIEVPPFETPKIESNIETSLNLGIRLISDVNLNDADTSLELDNVKLTTFGISAEKDLYREQNLSVSAALSGEAGFGEGKNFEINGTEALGDTDYRRLQVYGDVIARYDGGDETNWTPFAAVGVGLVEEKIKSDSFGDDQQNFKALTPKTHFRAGVEKKLSDRVTLGISAGKTVDLD